MYDLPDRNNTASNTQTQASSLESGCSPTNPDRKETRSSMLYNVLPVVVQSRLYLLPSLRQSISDLCGRAISSKSFSIHSHSSEAVSPGTLPPTCSSRRGSRSQASIMSTDTEEMEYRDDGSSRPTSSMSTTPPFAVFETTTGVNWKYANQGISLLTQAYQESNALAHDADESSALLTRQLYLHGMAYLLRGLPSELTMQETLSLQVAIPGCITSVADDSTAHALVPRSHQRENSSEAAGELPSVIHRITATIVFQMFVIFQFLLPYIKLFIGQAYRFERDHKVAQRVVNKSILTMDELGRRSLQLSQTVCQMNDGKVGQAINDLTIWWVRGLTGGVQQGISEGFVVIRDERIMSPKGRRVEKSG